MLLAFKYLAPLVPADGVLVAVLGSIAAAVVILLWWLFFSRARWFGAAAAILSLMIVAAFAVRFVVHLSIAGGMMGLLLYVLGVAAAAAGAGGLGGHRRSASCRPGARAADRCGRSDRNAPRSTLIRTDGIGGGIRQGPGDGRRPPKIVCWRRREDLKPLPARPAKTPRDCADRGASGDPAATGGAGAGKGRGAGTPRRLSKMDRQVARIPRPERDSVVRGVRINTDWAASPPVQMWRRPIGPGWSSFSVRGDLLYTQEQRGNEEIVACYRVTTGEPVWRHADPVRFYESNGGAGPRSTPTHRRGSRLLDGRDRNPQRARCDDRQEDLVARHVDDTAREVPVLGHLELAARRRRRRDRAASAARSSATTVATGKQRWFGPLHGGSYSSPHLVTIDGVTAGRDPQRAGSGQRNPADGKLLWEYEWEGGAIVQPAVTEDGDILINAMSTRPAAWARGGSPSSTAPTAGQPKSAGRRTG